ncbi:MAG: GNAT family N-acetyltransferase [Bacteroidota bacterium]
MPEIRTLSFAELFEASLLIPEFKPHYPLSEYQKRLDGIPHLSLGAFKEGKIMGFKSGYEVEPGVFYSWVGGVLPDFRRQQVARLLAVRQEEWLREKGYHTLRMKTRNKFRNMLLFAIGNGFKLTKVEQRDGIDDWRIFLEKGL